MDLMKTAAAVAGVADSAVKKVKTLVAKYEAVTGMSGEEKRLAVKRQAGKHLPGVPGFLVDAVIQLVLTALRGIAGTKA